MPKKILITGGCGFLGHHFVEHLLKNTNWEIVIFDKLNYASSGFDRLRDIDVYDDKRVLTLSADFTNPIENGLAKEIGQVDYIVHMGAETHVDNSIEDPKKFFKANVMGTLEMLEFARKVKLKKFIYFSTDEVFGPAPEGVNYKEGDRHNPSNPYSASKAAAEDACISYANTYKLPIMITNTMNIFGERQHPEKFIPLVVKKVQNGEEVLIHSNSQKTKAGSRFWIHARNVSDAVLFVLKNIDEYLDIHDETKGKFNIVGEKEVDNLKIAEFVAETIEKPLKYKMVDFHSSRPGHDLRYALSGEKLAHLGWIPPETFEKSLRKTIQWTIKNPKWINL